MLRPRRIFSCPSLDCSIGCCDRAVACVWRETTADRQRDLSIVGETTLPTTVDDVLRLSPKALATYLRVVGSEYRLPNTERISNTVLPLIDGLSDILSSLAVELPSRGPDVLSPLVPTAAGGVHTRARHGAAAFARVDVAADDGDEESESVAHGRATAGASARGIADSDADADAAASDSRRDGWRAVVSPRSRSQRFAAVVLPSSLRALVQACADFGSLPFATMCNLVEVGEATLRRVVEGKPGGARR